jgi:hypothetical protein
VPRIPSQGLAMSEMIRNDQAPRGQPPRYAEQVGT